MNTFLKNVKKATKRHSLGGKSKSKITVNQDTDGGDDTGGNSGGEGGAMLVSSPRSLDEFDEVVIDKYHHPHQSPGSVKTDYITALPLRTLGSFNFDNPTTSNQQSQPTRSVITTTPFTPLLNEANVMFQLCNMTTVILEVRKNPSHTTQQSKQIQNVFMNIPVPLSTLTNICIDKTQVLKSIILNSSNTNSTVTNALECILKHHRYWQEKTQNLSTSSSTKLQQQQENKKKDDDDGMFGWMSSCGLSSTFSFDELTDTLTNTFCGGDLCAVYNDGDDGVGHATTATTKVVENSLSSSRIIAVSDTSSCSYEMSYVIELHAQEERITIIFKGPRTKIVDSVTDSILAPNPGGGSNCDSNGIGIHRGFYNALFGNNSGSSSGGVGSKYMEIQQIVEQLLITEARNYKLYLTGYGSGGAIATLFGFYAAGDGASGSSSFNIPVPITIVSVASPRVGNVAYATAFAEYESMGILRHLRIVNVGDPIPKGPRGFELVGCLSGDEEPSYHTGIEMLLSTNGVDFIYSGLDVLQKKKSQPPLTTNTTGKNDNGDYLACHYSTVYSDRMAYVESDLQQLSLNVLYRDKAYGSMTATTDELWV